MTELVSGRRTLLQRLLGGVMAGAGLSGLSRTAAAQAAPAPATLLNIGLCVSDLEKSLQFYTQVFGFEPDAEPTRLSGAPLEALLETEKLDLSIRFLSKQGIRLELLHFASPKAAGGGPRKPLATLGWTHLAFKVTNVKAIMDAAKHMGGQVLENTKLGKGDVIQAIFILDPDGNRIELQA